MGWQMGKECILRECGLSFCLRGYINYEIGMNVKENNKEGEE